MTRATVMLVVTALVLGRAVGHAHDGRGLLAYADDSRPGKGDNDPPRRAERPRTAQAPAPPAPPAPPRGINVRINGQKLDLSGIDGMVKNQLDAARNMIRNNPNIPAQLRTKLLARFDKVRGSVDRRLARIKGKSLSEVGEELEAMGEEIEQAMEGLEEELEQLGNNFAKDFKFKFKDKTKKHADEPEEPEEPDEPDEAAVPMAPDLDDLDDSDMRQALNDLKGMAISPQQKEKIQQIRAEADRTVTAARTRLEDLSGRLETALADARTSTADIERYVDDISKQEATIRKARIVSWVKARNVLGADQRKRIEAAANKRHK